MSELHDRVDYNKLKFENVGPTQDVSFYEYISSKELFNAIKSSRFKFDDALKRQNEFLKKLKWVKETNK